MSKTGYEIRADILALAKDYLDKQTQATLEYNRQMLAAGNELIVNYLKTNVAQPYGMQELLKAAQEMYSFVSEKPSDHRRGAENTK